MLVCILVYICLIVCGFSHQSDSNEEVLERGTGIVFAYANMNNQNIDHFEASAEMTLQSIHDIHPEIPMYLITNIKKIKKSIKKLLWAVYEVDEMVLNYMREMNIVHSPQHMMIKAWSVLSAWKNNKLPQQLLILDLGLIVVKTNAKWNLNSFFDPLQVMNIISMLL